MRVTLLPVLLVLLLALVTTGERAQAQSVGFFPSSIELDNALRGQTYHSMTTLVNQTPEPRTFDLRATGETASWTTFVSPGEPDTPIQQISVPGESETRVQVVIEIPDSAPNGEVSGVNAYDGYTRETAETRRGLVAGFEQPVTITITGDQVIDLVVGDVSAGDVEIGGPLRVRAQFTNRGNVDTAPDLAIRFFSLPASAAAEPVEELNDTLEPVRPGESATLETQWETAGQSPGRYRADYAVAFNEERLAVGSFEFELLPAGSAERAGVIASLTVIEPVQAGARARADVEFENQGEAELLAHFAGNVYQGGVAITAAESPDPLLVQPGESVVLSAFFELPGDASGSYEIRGSVVFDGGQTDEASAAFSLAGGGDPAMSRWLALGGIALGVMGTVVVGGAWAWKRR